ncbi:hypothetical protein P6709_11565 [Jeotgalibacillus sp. ET6]|uniref:hypothetical protein n=1 Tax=Jeotgalibacillus sp. ET6 TaxID=3037260 RepID=UPI0024189C79|nr:hypothetical protein [Jeotgalibacillus sp. ET6]MDG5472382.1 hypothetical protein [Jeotgalibacillus sp. ET6]
MRAIQPLAEQATKRIYERDPSLLDRYGDQGKTKCYEDNVHHFRQLHSAYELKKAAFFIDYAVWLNGILSKHGMNEQHLIDNFEIMKEVLTASSQVEEEALPVYKTFLNQAISELTGQSDKGDD